MKFKKRANMMKTFKNYLPVLLMLVGMLFFRTAVADWSPVPSSSMEPTIFPGDVLLVNKTILGPAIPFTKSRLFSYGSPQRGDIITFYPSHTEDQYVKRVIGVPGDRIRTEGLAVFVNGQQLPLELDFSLQESGIITGSETIDGITHAIKVNATRGIKDIPEGVTVPPNSYFVMGDYRNNSEDSRYWGFVEEDRVIGKVTRVALSIADERSFKERVAYSIY